MQDSRDKPSPNGLLRGHQNNNNTMASRRGGGSRAEALGGGQTGKRSLGIVWARVRVAIKETTFLAGFSIDSQSENRSLSLFLSISLSFSLCISLSLSVFVVISIFENRFHFY